MATELSAGGDHVDPLFDVGGEESIDLITRPPYWSAASAQLIFDFAY